MHKIKDKEINKDTVTPDDIQYILRNEPYLTKETMQLVLGVGETKSSEYMKKVHEEMEKQKLLIPMGKVKKCSTKVFRDVFGI